MNSNSFKYLIGRFEALVRDHRDLEVRRIELVTELDAAQTQCSKQAKEIGALHLELDGAYGRLNDKQTALEELNRRLDKVHEANVQIITNDKPHTTEEMTKKAEE